MPELRLPEPENWAQTGKVALSVKVVLAVAFCYVVIRGLVAVWEGSYLTAIVWWATLGTPFLLVAAYLAVAVGGARQRVSSDSSGLTFRPDKRLSVAYFVVMAVLVPAAALFAVLLSRGELHVSTTRGMQIAVSVAFWALALLAVVALAAGIRRGGSGYLKFTPTRIEIADVLKTRGVPWNDVVDVRDAAATAKANHGGRAAVLCLREGTEEVVSGLPLYVTNGVALYWLVRHYWKHPEHRDELVDGRAPRRLAEGEFDLSA
ncbi:MAG: hypothetical protein VYB90_06155 [Actinomycetota bacterium]|nr:hypothetical protein [Actinomycetota bacterium]